MKRKDSSSILGVIDFLVMISELIFSVNLNATLAIAVIMKDEKLLAEVNDEWMEHAPSYFLYDDPNVSKDAKDIISKRIYKFYFGDKKISQETFDNLTNLYSDSFFIHEIRNTILLHAKHAPVYPIILGFEGYEWSQLMRFGYEKPLGETMQ